MRWNGDKRGGGGAVTPMTVGLSLVLAAWTVPAQAQTLDDARDAAFDHSFVLRADGARQDGAEARLRGTQDAFLPTVALLDSQPLRSKVTYNPDVPVSTFGPDTTPRSEARQYGISVDLPLFDGFQRWNTMLSSRKQVEAGRRLTQDARLQVMLETATAFLAVRRDRSILADRRAQVVSLRTILNQVDAQLAVNDATRTDRALAFSRVSDAMTGVDQAAADLMASEMEFCRLTGLSADRLAPPRLPALPRSEAEIVDLVRSGNPRLVAAGLDAQAAQYLADAAKGALLPQVGFQFTHGRQTDVTATLHSITDTTAKIQIKIPLYVPGSIPRIAEASAFAQQKSFEADDAVSRIVTAARIAFRRRAAAAAQTADLARRVGALRAAVRGYEIERGAGFRTILDELNGRAELAQAEVLLAASEAERDRLAFVLAAATGQLDEPVMAAAPDDAVTGSHRPAATRLVRRVARAAPRVAATALGLRTTDTPAATTTAALVAPFETETLRP